MNASYVECNALSGDGDIDDFQEFSDRLTGFVSVDYETIPIVEMRQGFFLRIVRTFLQHVLLIRKVDALVINPDRKIGVGVVGIGIDGGEDLRSGWSPHHDLRESATVDGAR